MRCNWGLLLKPAGRAAAAGDNKHGRQAALFDSVEGLATVMLWSNCLTLPSPTPGLLLKVVPCCSRPSHDVH